MITLETVEGVEAIEVSIDHDGDLLFRTEGASLYVIKNDILKLTKFLIREQSKTMDKFSSERRAWQDLVSDADVTEEIR